MLQLTLILAEIFTVSVATAKTPPPWKDKPEHNRWIVELVAEGSKINDKGFRSAIKKNKSAQVSVEKSQQTVRLVKDLALPMTGLKTKAVSKSSKLNNLVVVEASEEAIEALILSDRIVDFEKDNQYELFNAKGGLPFTPIKPPGVNDPLFVNQWGITNAGFDKLWFYAPQLRSVVGKTLIFVVDTWVDAEHEDFNRSSIIDAQPQYTETPEYHGTHVAGIISSKTNNSKGISGALWDANIIPINVCEYFCDTSAIIQALYTIADNYTEQGLPKVVNMSLGGRFYSPQTHAAVKYAQSKDVLIVAAAGNSTERALNFYPASYPDVISVGAIRADGKLASFSNYGDKEVTVVAPGQNIMSTLPPEVATYEPAHYYPEVLEGGYGNLHGTSMASPFVAAAAAAMRAFKPELPQYVIRQKLEASSPRVKMDGYTGGVYKRLDVFKAYQELHRGATPPATRAANNIQERAIVDVSRTCFLRYLYNGPCEDCILIRGRVAQSDAPVARIRWMANPYFIDLTPFPIGSSEVQANGEFDVKIFYPLPPGEENAGTWILQNTHFLVGYVEDRDESGEVRDLRRIEFSDGSSQFQIGNHFCGVEDL